MGQVGFGEERGRSMNQIRKKEKKKSLRKRGKAKDRLREKRVRQ